MIQIISDNPSDWITWMGEVIGRLEEYPVKRLCIIADIDNEEMPNIIEFMNGGTDDIYRFGGILQKEAIKHEIAEQFGFDDDSWEIEEDEDDDI